jgi:hypothetical protein
LIAFLYNEADEQERSDFQLHLNECSTCRAEVASLGIVRESIVEWRDEALAGFVSQPVATKTTGKSASAALRQFFDLSPFWMKSVTAFAVVVFFVLAAFALLTLQDNNVPVPAVFKVGYTQEEIDRIVKEAIEQQKGELIADTFPNIEPLPPKRKRSQKSAASQYAKSRRPLSRAEREQLAADLRLLSNDDDLQLLEDRINQ